MTYYYASELYHHGIKGQKWGVRRFQNEDGSLTPAGKERYGVDENGHINSEKGAKRYIDDQKKTNRFGSIKGHILFNDVINFENEVQNTPEYKELLKKDEKLVDEIFSVWDDGDDNYDYTAFNENRKKMARMEAEHAFEKMLDKYGEYTLSAFLDTRYGNKDKDIKKHYMNKLYIPNFDL